MSLQKQVDHSERTERYYSRYLGTCHCKNCIILPSPYLCPNCNGELSRFQSGPESLLPQELQKCTACELPYPLWSKWKAMSSKVDELEGVLSRLCLSLSVGSGDEHTTAEQYEKRIQDGIATIVRVETRRKTTKPPHPALRPAGLATRRGTDDSPTRGDATMTMKIDGFTLNVERDDRGALVAELWHNESGKTVGITEVDNYEMARWWGSKLANMTAAKAS